MGPEREWFEKDYYKTLGVAEDASASDITKAYWKLAKKLHPDANPGGTVVEDRFKKVASATTRVMGLSSWKPAMPVAMPEAAANSAPAAMWWGLIRVRMTARHYSPRSSQVTEGREAWAATSAAAAAAEAGSRARSRGCLDSAGSRSGPST